MHHKLLYLLPVLVVAAFLFSPFLASAKDFNYISPQDLKAKLDNKEPLHLVDIQVEEEFQKHHIVGAIPTYSYPVKSDEEKAKLAGALAQASGDDLPVVIICPRGKGGAERTYDYLKEKGIAEDRLFILEKGQEGWPYEVE